MNARAIQLLLLVITDACAIATGRALSPLQETLQHSLSLSDNQIAVLQGPALALPTILFALPLGVLIDRSSRVRLCLILSALGSTGTILTALSSRFDILILGRCLAGLSMAGVTIAIFSLIADLYLPAERGRAKAMIVVGQNLATAASFAVGGRLLGLFDSVNSWRYALLWMSGLAGVLALVTVLLVREPERHWDVSSPSSTEGMVARLWAYRALVVPLVLGVVFAELPVYAMLAWASPAFSRGFALSPDRVGDLMGTAMFISGLVGPILGGVLADVCQRVRGPRLTVSSLCALALLGVPMGLFAITPSLVLAAVLFTVYNTIISATVGMSITLFTVVIPSEVRGLSLAVLAATDALFGYALAPMIVSSVSGFIGGSESVGISLTAVCLAASLGCALAFALSRKCFASGASHPAMSM